MITAYRSNTVMVMSLMMLSTILIRSNSLNNPPIGFSRTNLKMKKINMKITNDPKASPYAPFPRLNELDKALKKFLRSCTIIAGIIPMKGDTNISKNIRKGGAKANMQ